MNKNLFKTFIRIYPIVFKPVWKENLLLSFVDIFHGLSFAVLIIVTQIFFDIVTSSVGIIDNQKKVLMIALLLILCQIISQLLNGFVNFYADVVREKSFGKISIMLQKKIEKIAPIDFEKNTFLDNINKADRGAEEACTMVDTINSLFTFYVPYFILMGAYMFQLNFMLILSVFIVFVPVLVTHCVQMHFGDAIEREIAPIRREAEAYEKTLTSLENYKETKVLFAARYFINLYKNRVSEWNRKSWKKRKKEEIINLGLNIFSFLAYGMILLMLVYLCAKGQISIGSFAVVFSAIDVMFYLMQEIFKDGLGNVAKNAGQINNFLNLMQWAENPQKSIDITNGKIALKKVSFKYPEAEKNSLEDITLEIDSNETIAIVGENGSGKTTLSKIIMGIYKPDSGKVLIDGNHMDENHNGYSNISAVFQKFNRYKLNVEDNIIISNLKNKKEYQDMLSQVDKDLKLDNQVILARDFDGIDLSGGQWQKIAIARGIHKESKIFILDEPTSAIDPIQESQLYQTFMSVSQNKTCIIITHRLGLAKIADRIVVLKNGRIVEEGKHEWLLEQNGEYCAMWSAQADWYHCEKKTVI